MLKGRGLEIQTDRVGQPCYVNRHDFANAYGDLRKMTWIYSTTNHPSRADALTTLTLDLKQHTQNMSNCELYASPDRHPADMF